MWRIKTYLPCSLINTYRTFGLDWLYWDPEGFWIKSQSGQNMEDVLLVVRCLLWPHAPGIGSSTLPHDPGEGAGTERDKVVKKIIKNSDYPDQILNLKKKQAFWKWTYSKCLWRHNLFWFHLQKQYLALMMDPCYSHTAPIRNEKSDCCEVSVQLKNYKMYLRCLFFLSCGDKTTAAAEGDE